MYRNKFTVSLMALFAIASGPAFGSSGDKAEVKGMIIARAGETLIVKSVEGTTTVVLTDDTTTKDNTGLFGLDRQHLSDAALIPGLKVDVEGVSDEQGRVVAKTITTDGDDLETAEMVQAGLHPTAEQVQRNMQAIAANKGQLAAHTESISTNSRISLRTNNRLTRTSRTLRRTRIALPR